MDIIPLSELDKIHRQLIGGKGYALGQLISQGYNVPPGFCVTTLVYDQFLDQTGLRDLITLELNRKNMGEMRWEEIWDTALRIRNLFLRMPFPANLKKTLKAHCDHYFQTASVVVRSSAGDEDAAGSSFAGLHESYVNVRGFDAVIKHIQLVWASLWSDRALLYRRELGLDVEHSAMAVVVQQLVQSDVSGIVFSRNPNDPEQTIIEAVHGLNQGLVDGSIEPDQWLLNRSTGNLVKHIPVDRARFMVCTDEGVTLAPLPPDKAKTAPLNAGQVNQLFQLAHNLEQQFGSPQDIEWTLSNNRLFVLQSRPVTAKKADSAEDKRSWYLSLTRSFDNLQQLHHVIVNERLPAMASEAKRLDDYDLEQLSDHELALEIDRRRVIYQHWHDVYWDEFIPFAHGVRLFGEFYNDTLNPFNPAEFILLLNSSDMISVKRNQQLAELAAEVKQNPELKATLESEGYFAAVCEPFIQRLDAFLEEFSGLAWGAEICFSSRNRTIKHIVQLASKALLEKEKENDPKIQQMVNHLLSHFQGEQLKFARQLLELARVSYKIRDDDNIYLSRIESQLIKATELAKNRLAAKGDPDSHLRNADELIALLSNPGQVPKTKRKKSKNKQQTEKLKARQIVGQPAVAGFNSGIARVVLTSDDLFEFKAGEILVCIAIDPNMSFVVPLAAAIVECRGGMLIHGAIIAREYGIPCVTGIPLATSRISTGDKVTVDGYLGIVTLDKKP
jgi:phosphoenolpyruvate synthase/pyruvate phosphate dikinase